MLDREISHFNYKSNHYDKCKFALKLIRLLTISNLFSLEPVQKCQHCQLCVLRENLTEVFSISYVLVEIAITYNRLDISSFVPRVPHAGIFFEGTSRLFITSWLH